MIGFLVRTLWRILIFGIGVGLIGITVMLFPYADNYLPVLLVWLIIYCVFAYGIIPLLVRLLRLVIKPHHIPVYVTTGDGWPSDPVNIAIIAHSRQQLERAMDRAGWYTADRLSLRTGLHAVFSIICNRPYPHAPLSTLFLFNRAQDIGFEMPTNPALSARTRHHVRFWRLEQASPTTKDRHYAFWLKKLRHLLHLEKEIWIGAATEETHPIAIQWFSGQLTHGGSHDSDKERDFIIASLQTTQQIKSLSKTTPGEKVRFRGQQLRTIYVTDGTLSVAVLKSHV